MLSPKHLYHLQGSGNIIEEGVRKGRRKICCKALFPDHELLVAVVLTQDPHKIGPVNMLPHREERPSLSIKIMVSVTGNE